MTTAAPERLLLSVLEAAHSCRLSRAMFYKMLACGRIGPAPIRFGKSIRFSTDEMRAWAAAGAPPREEWTRMREGTR